MQNVTCPLVFAFSPFGFEDVPWHFILETLLLGRIGFEFVDFLQFVIWLEIVLNNVEKSHEFLNSSGPLDELLESDLGLFVKVLVQKGLNLFGPNSLGNGQDFVSRIASINKQECDSLIRKPSFFIEVKNFKQELYFLLVIYGTEDDQTGEHFNGIDSALFLGVEGLEGFLIVSKDLNKFADGDGKGLTDGLEGRIILA
jgi:hypothetical protein